jgi:hypothetical protein
MRKGILFLLVVSLLLPAAVVLAAGQDKVAVCHLNDDGSFVPITIADPALDSHLAHGDAVVGVDVNENCEPLVVPLAGCFSYDSSRLYVLTDGTNPQFVGGSRIYEDPGCTFASSAVFPKTAYLVWATSLAEATATCPLVSILNVFETGTRNLYECY